MILIIGDVHCQFHVINEQIRYAENKLGKTIDAVVVLGDMGIYESPLKNYFYKGKNVFLRKVYFLEGNHEEFAKFCSLINEFAQYMTYLPRGHVTKICDIRFLSLGGASYMDAMITPSGSEIMDHDIDKCLEHEEIDVDLVVSHDCPSGIGVTSAPGLEYYGEPGFIRGKELIERFRPKKWFFGHHHRWFSQKIQGTYFFGLPESWKGFGLLDEQLNYESVKNAVENHESWVQKLIKRLFRS